MIKKRCIKEDSAPARMQVKKWGSSKRELSKSNVSRTIIPMFPDVIHLKETFLILKCN